jgi:hypothetical protein
MSLSLFVLALYVFMQSYVLRGWGTIDPKLIGLVGLLFVVLVIVETVFLVYRGQPLVNWRRPTQQ